jgi:tetratricopeptide (TPR) repeat protein
MKLILFFLALFYLSFSFGQANPQFVPAPFEIEQNASAIYRIYGCDSAVSYLTVYYNTSSITMYNRAVFRQKCEDYQGALKDINDVLIDDKDEFMQHNALNLKATICLELSLLNEALVAVNKAINNKNASFNDFNLRGNIYSEMGYYKDALNDFNISLKMNSSNADSWAYRSRIKSKLEMYDSALEDINMALKLSPKDGYYHYGKGMILGKMNGSGCESIWDAIRLGYQPAMSIYEEYCK